MIDVRRQDVGADVVYLPRRNLLVLHPDLDYAEALAAAMSVLPNLHIDVVQRLVEKVTPRPRAERRRWPLIGVRMALAALAASIAVALAQPAHAEPEFGANWADAVASLGLDCFGDDDTVRFCHYGEDRPIFKMRGFRHETGSLYVSHGPRAKVIFVFDDLDDATRYADLHPEAVRQGRAVVW